MAGYPNQYHYPYIPPHMLQAAYQQKYGHPSHNAVPSAWMPKHWDNFYCNRYSNNAHLQMGIPVNAQLRMAVPNATIGGQGNRGHIINQTSRKRQRTSGSPHETDPKHAAAKKKKLRSESPSTSKKEPSSSTRTPDSHKRTPSPVPQDAIAAAVAAYAEELVAKDSLSISKRKTAPNRKESLKVPSAEQRTSNSTSEENSERTTTNNSTASSSGQSNLVLSRGVDTPLGVDTPPGVDLVVVPPPGAVSPPEINTPTSVVTPPGIVTPPNMGRNSVKRRAAVASLANSAPPAVKVKHARIETDEEQRPLDLEEIPSTSKQANNQRRNSLPAPFEDTLAEQIMDRFSETKQHDVDLNRKEDMRLQLENIIHEVMPFTMLFLVGSSRNCFGTRTSDADMCLMVTDGEMNQKRDAKNILYQLRDYLRERCHFMHHLQVIPAKVPIIKFRHKYSGIECDLNINNATGIRNTHLLQAYAKVDYRVAPLVLIVKQWASHFEINDASQGTLSSYSLVLMVLNYLQVHCKPPVIPALQQRYSSTFSKFADVRQYHSIDHNTPLPSHIRYQSQNKQDVGSLLRGFFDYYANHFDFQRGVMSVRCGKVLNLNQVKISGGDWLGKFILIEEPFDGTNTARSIYRKDKFNIIKSQLEDTHAKFRSASVNMKLHKVIGKYLK